MSRELVMDLLGIPFAMGGSSRAGADCRWIAIQAAQRFGRQLRDPWNDVCGRWQQLTADDIDELVPEGWTEVLYDHAEPGDLFLMRVTADELDALCHLAILVEPGLILLAARGTTSRLERITPAVRSRIEYCWRLPPC